MATASFKALQSFTDMNHEPGCMNGRSSSPLSLENRSDSIIFNLSGPLEIESVQKPACVSDTSYFNGAATC